MAYNSKYTGAQVEARLDAVPNKVDEAPKTDLDYVRRNGKWVNPSYEVTNVTSASMTFADVSSNEYNDLF